MSAPSSEHEPTATHPDIEQRRRAFYLPAAPPSSLGASFFFFLVGARIVPVAKREVADVITLPILERIFAQINRACEPEHISRRCTIAYRASTRERRGGGGGGAHERSQNPLFGKN